jgi:tripartite-type tricarboxylate transporter receptor subunit TctC
VPITVSALPTALPHAKAGSLRALALMSAKRSSLLPDVPTMAEATGQPLEADILTGLLAPGGTPKEIIDLLHREVARIVAVPEFRERLVALGFETIASTPAEFADWIKTEIAKWAKVIRDANIGVQ